MIETGTDRAESGEETARQPASTPSSSHGPSGSRMGSLLRSMVNFFRRLRRHRVPVHLQLSAMECGAACLTMILNYHGRKTHVAECRENCGTGRDGASAQRLAQAARSYGLRVKAFSVEPGDFTQIQLPAIAHWEFNHFVVVEGFSPRVVAIIDPAAGRRRLTPEEFAAGFTGVVLTMEPGIHFNTLRKSSRTTHYTYLLSMLRAPGTPGLLLQVLCASLCLFVLGLALPLCTQIIVDRVLPLRLAGVMTILGIGLALIVVSEGVASYLRSCLLMYLRQRMDMRVMLGFFEHLLSLPFRFFQQRPSGDLLMRLASNITIREALTGQTLSTVLDGTLVVGYLAVLLVRAPLFGFLALLVGVFQAALLLTPSRRLFELTQRSLASQSATQSYLVETLSGVAALKASGTEDHALDHWAGLFTSELNASLRRDHFTTVIDAGMTALRTLSPLLLLWVGTVEVLHGRMSLGTMLALNALAGAFFAPLTLLALNTQGMQLAMAHLERIADVLNAQPEQIEVAAGSTPALKGGVEFKDVSFRYDGNGPLVLRNVTLTIEAGQKIAIVGRTGSGKSTLMTLLLGLYEPSEGVILFDEIPLRQMNYRALRNQIGVVLQEAFLVSGSIRANIAFGNPGLDMDQIMKAARMAAIHEEILRMPMGYETGLTERGAGLSGGQRQRISLARALARRPSIVVLDEATSQLDVITEETIERNLEQLTCTRIVIAHRLNTIHNADRIFVMDCGTIVEAGTHQELMTNSGCYAELISSQTQMQGSR